MCSICIFVCSVFKCLRFLFICDLSTCCMRLFTSWFSVAFSHLAHSHFCFCIVFYYLVDVCLFCCLHPFIWFQLSIFSPGCRLYRTSLVFRPCCFWCIRSCCSRWNSSPQFGCVHLFLIGFSFSHCCWHCGLCALCLFRFCVYVNVFAHVGHIFIFWYSFGSCVSILVSCAIRNVFPYIAHYT